MNRDPLTQFFYLLMRDQLPTARVEEVMNNVRAAKGKQVTHSAPHLEAYAALLAQEIRELTPTVIYTPCKEHMGLPATAYTGFTNVLSICPHCASMPG